MPGKCDIEFKIPLEPSLKHLRGSYGTPITNQNEFLQSLGKPHVESFNHLIDHGLEFISQNLTPAELQLRDDSRLSISITNLRLLPPTMPDGSMAHRTPKIYPSECRQRKSTYSGRLCGKIQWSINGVPQNPIEKDFGEIPIMVKSNRCHLKDLSPTQLIYKNEHENEWGGYFILKGNERIIRMLLNTRRNYPIAICRRSWKQRGAMFSDKGIFIRCVADDQTSTNNVLHFVTDGTVKLMISHRKSLYFFPLCLMLKCLLNVTDYYVYKQLIKGKEDDSYFKSCIRNMLQSVHIEGLDTQFLAKSYVGKTFRIKFPELPPWKTDEEICDYLIEKSVAIHLKENLDKFNLLVFMTQKLYDFVEEKCCEEGADALMVQEVLTGGNVYQQVLKDRLQGCLNNLKNVISKKLGSGKLGTLTQSEMASFCKRAGNIQAAMDTFIGTGNAVTRFGTTLPQEKGLTIVAENINRMRYMSHFKAVHRGAFFVEMRTTEARQLLPDAWGFICPVHTPDGAPCGLLNHLSKFCQVTDAPDKKLVENIPNVLADLGILPIDTLVNIANTYYVLLDGKVVGFVPDDQVQEFTKNLRILKVEGQQIPKTTEIVLVPKKEMKTQYPGLFLFTGPSRLMRPVRNLALNKVELIGTFEQVYLDICIKLKDAYENLTTHQELSQTAFLSNLASLIPMPDCNQSPRNMYQCQMGKQSMGTPCHTWNIQSETKLYRLLMPSSPLFRPAHYDYINLDDFPMGVNAVVAVISYTGYDMEDAMIINKSSFERGFGHGSILKSEFIDLKPGSYFERDPSKAELLDKLDEDGFPHPGKRLEENDPLCCYFDQTASKYVIERYHGKEMAYVDNVRLCSDASIDSCRGCVTLRVPRNPTVGDKFASRAGQKGICSQLWPAEDLPFTESGMVPDVVFNPHGFPSRMTIAMMIELMAGKSAAIHGKVHDATPFRHSENNTAIDYYGKLLEAGGYSYYGTEKMYSGVDGREMTASIFYGIVYYQRLRHMVLDKWQVRSTGAVDTITQQPIKGRRRGGGVRFGEMERDSLISHGASALVHDRLFECSDKYKSFICESCHNMLSSSISKCHKTGEKKEVCRLCPDGGKVKIVEIPYIFRIAMTEKRGMKALELWCRRVTEGYPGVKIENMTTSWRDGLAFCALIHHFRPDLIDFERLDKRDIYKNNELAFRIAERQLGIPALLDAEDMVEYEVPDRLSILTYLSQFYQAFVSNQQGATSPSTRTHTTKVPDIISPSAKTQKTPKVGAGRLESCWSCRRPVFLAERLVAGGKLRHRTCFTCKRCGHQLNLIGCYETEDGDFVCETCPDEDKREDSSKNPFESEVFKGDGDICEEVKDNYSLNFESALESLVQNRKDDTKLKFLQDLVDDSSDFTDSMLDLNKSKTMSDSDMDLSVDVSLSGKNLPPDSVNDNQHSTASIENLNVKIKKLLGRDFSDTLSLLNKEPDSFIADISEIIDNIINDAVKEAETRVEESLNNKLSFPQVEEAQEESVDVNSNDKKDVDNTIDSDTLNIEAEAVIKDVTVDKEDEEQGVKEKVEEVDEKLVEEPTSKPHKIVEDYPEDLNPFADDEDEVKQVKPPVTPRKPPVPAARTRAPQTPVFNKSGQKIIEAPKVNLNPFWSDGEPSSDEDVTKPVPAPRSSVRSQENSPFKRSEYGSFTSLSSIGSSASALRRKKGPAPLPPSGTKSLQYPTSPESGASYKSPSPTPTIRSHRKSKPAPPPPPLREDDNQLIAAKKEKNYENKIKQNLSVPDKSSYGKWKRKKGQAPGLPIPQRRRITPLPLPELYRELEDLEIQQRELERQGVTIEQTIRNYEAEALEREEDGIEGGGKDVEGLILQLFEIVNQKNELFRRQAELMLLRRQQRLEEEHADIEYQIRCLMGRPERNKTDSDKAQEEELIRRLVEVVERRNEIIECLDMDRKREVEEDESIHHHLEAFAGKKGFSEEKEKHGSFKSSATLLRLIKKKKSKKEKSKEHTKVKRDADKDIDETSKEEVTKTPKTKKKWFKP